jgi:arylsulfatase A-like enzyme/Flp pilus assembly protein TadD
MAALLACAALAAVVGCAKRDTRPSVLVVIVDTLRADYLGCYGAGTGATPNMDRLASEGAMFSTCVSSVPVTLPSISTILTSTYPPYHGVRDNGMFTLDSSLLTMAEVFREEGYATGAVVGAYVVTDGTGIEQGFSFFDSEFTGSYAEESSLPPAKVRQVARTQRRAAEVTEVAARWLASARRPFLLMAHYFDPHSPYDPPPEYGRRFRESVYLGEVGYTDSQVGRLVEAAREASAEGGLIVALVADHGEGLGEHGEEQHGYFIYDSTMLVPFIVAQEGAISPGLVVEGQTSLADLAPTTAELAGLPVPDVWQGESHAAVLKGDKPGALPDRGCYLETYRTRYSYDWSELVGIRHGGWKLVRAPRSELYNLSADPGEMENVYAAEPEKASDMERRLDELLASIRGPFNNLRPAEDMDEAQVEMLESLGYVMPKKSVSQGPLPDPKDMVVKLNVRFEATRKIEEAKRLSAGGDTSGAEALLLLALELNPKSTVARHDLGHLYWNRGDRDEGLRLMKEAADMAETEATPHFNLALTYMSVRRYEDALVEFEKGIAIAPEDAVARHKYAMALETAGRTEEAIEQYYRSLELDPSMRAAQFDAAVLLARSGRNREAAGLLEDLIRKNPNDEMAHTARRMLGRSQ